MSIDLEIPRKENKNFLKDYERNRAFIIDLIKKNDFLRNQTSLSGTDDTKPNYGIQQTTIDNVSLTDAEKEVEKINSLLTNKIADVDAYTSFYTKSRTNKLASRDILKSDKMNSIINYNDVLILYNNVIRLYKKPGTSQPTKSMIGNKLNALTRNIDLLLLEYNNIIDYIFENDTTVHRIVFKLLEAKGFYEIIKNSIFRNDYNIITQENIEVQYRKEILSLSQSKREALNEIQVLDELQREKYKTIDELKFDTNLYIERIENSTGVKIPIELKRRFKDMGKEEINRTLDSFNLLQKEEPIEIKNIEDRINLLLSNLQKNTALKRELETNIDKINRHLVDMQRYDKDSKIRLQRLKDSRVEYEAEIDDIEREADKFRLANRDYLTSNKYKQFMIGIKSREDALDNLEQEIQAENNILKQLYSDANQFISNKNQMGKQLRDITYQIDVDAKSLRENESSKEVLSRSLKNKIDNLQASLKIQPSVKQNRMATMKKIIREGLREIEGEEKKEGEEETLSTVSDLESLESLPSSRTSRASSLTSLESLEGDGRKKGGRKKNIKK